MTVVVCTIANCLVYMYCAVLRCLAFLFICLCASLYGRLAHAATVSSYAASYPASCAYSLGVSS